MIVRHLLYLLTLVVAPALFACVTTTPLSNAPGRTVAVWNVENLTPDEGPPDLGEHLAARVHEAIQKKGEHKIVERERLLLALEELNLGTTSLVDESTQLQLGRMVGAQLMVFGGYQVIAGQMRLDLRLVEVETGRILNTAQRTIQGSDITTWLRAAEETAQELI